MKGEEALRLRGVNLGGWLVLERWMTPSLFEGTIAQDELSFMQASGTVEQIERHRREFIQEDDFHWLAEHSINAVRIPVGYWILDGYGPFTACISYLDWAIQMAEKYDIKVLIDLHAVKGSQNGKDHSGQVGDSGWFAKSTYRRETIEVLKRLAERYKDSSAVWGVELVNEPGLGPIKYFTLRRFYRQAYRELVGVARPGTHIVFSDAFVPWLFSGILKQAGEYPPVMDIHWYQFGRTKISSYFARLAKRPSEIDRLQRRQPVIVGEWSGMLSHKTLASVPRLEQSILQRRHIEQQLVAYDGALGWFYWTYKTEDAGIWDFRTQVESGNLLLAEKPVLH